MEQAFLGQLMNKECSQCHVNFKIVSFLFSRCILKPVHTGCKKEVIDPSCMDDDKRAIIPPQCPMCYSDCVGWMSTTITSRKMLPPPNPNDVIGELNWWEVDGLKGKFRPCCNSPFESGDMVIFPCPCSKHPLHVECFLIEKIGDFRAAKISVECSTCEAILNDEVVQVMVGF